jgi:hypothetical protein
MDPWIPEIARSLGEETSGSKIIFTATITPSSRAKASLSPVQETGGRGGIRTPEKTWRKGDCQPTL